MNTPYHCGSCVHIVNGHVGEVVVRRGDFHCALSGFNIVPRDEQCDKHLLAPAERVIEIAMPARMAEQMGIFA